MKRIVKWAAAVLILVTAASFATAQPANERGPVGAGHVHHPRQDDSALAISGYINIFGKATSKIPLIDWLKWGADQADAATKADSKIIAQAVERGFREKGQLVSGTARVDVVVDQTTSYWRGSVKQQLTMPCTATLAIDLDKVLANATFNPATKTIDVYLPALSIIAVESHTSKYTTAAEFSGGCWKWYDTDKATALEVRLLKSDWGALAREKVDPNAYHFREVAKNEATRFLKGLLEPINPDLKIVVNP